MGKRCGLLAVILVCGFGGLASAKPIAVNSDQCTFSSGVADCNTTCSTVENGCLATLASLCYQTTCNAAGVVGSDGCLATCAQDCNTECMATPSQFDDATTPTLCDGYCEQRCNSNCDDRCATSRSGEGPTCRDACRAVCKDACPLGPNGCTTSVGTDCPSKCQPRCAETCSVEQGFTCATNCAIGMNTCLVSTDCASMCNSSGGMLVCNNVLETFGNFAAVMTYGQAHNIAIDPHALDAHSGGCSVVSGGGPSSLIAFAMVLGALSLARRRRR